MSVVGVFLVYQLSAHFFLITVLWLIIIFACLFLHFGYLMDEKKKQEKKKGRKQGKAEENRCFFHLSLQINSFIRTFFDMINGVNHRPYRSVLGTSGWHHQSAYSGAPVIVRHQLHSSQVRSSVRLLSYFHAQWAASFGCRQSESQLLLTNVTARVLCAYGCFQVLS